jgi:hypothetical protein
VGRKEQDSQYSPYPITCQSRDLVFIHMSLPEPSVWFWFHAFSLCSGWWTMTINQKNKNKKFLPWGVSSWPGSKTSWPFTQRPWSLLCFLRKLLDGIWKHGKERPPLPREDAQKGRPSTLGERPLCSQHPLLTWTPGTWHQALPANPSAGSPLPEMAPAQHQDKEVILSHTRVRIYWLLNHSEWKLQLCHSSW